MGRSKTKFTFTFRVIFFFTKLPTVTPKIVTKLKFIIKEWAIVHRWHTVNHYAPLIKRLKQLLLVKEPLGRGSNKEIARTIIQRFVVVLLLRR